jgi:hypothetical protein
MACLGEYEIVTETRSLDFSSGDVVTTLSAPTGKRVLYGWVPDDDVAYLRGRPVQGGAAWEFTLRRSGGGSASVDLAISSALLD